MADYTPIRATGRRARREQKIQMERQARQQQKVWPPVAMCIVLALILALSIVFGRPSSMPVSGTTAATTPPPAATTASAAAAVTSAAEQPTDSPTATPAPRSSYKGNAGDVFDQAYQSYKTDILDKKYAGRTGATADLDVFAREGLSPQWFGLTPVDLPMLRGKLLSGAPTAYTMSLISLVMGYDPPTHPKDDDAATLRAWLEDFETRRASAADAVKQRKLEGLGAFALPAVYDEIEAGTGGDLLSQLPALADGFDGLAQADTASWTQADWLAWLRGRMDTWSVLAAFLKEPISLPGF